MQGFNDREWLNNDESGYEKDTLCEITRRIIIICPFPTQIRSLVMELMVRCYDVLVFHYENEPILSKIPSDLVVSDRSKTPEMVPMKIASNFRSVLLLVGDEQQQQVLQSTNEHAALRWPCPMPEALEKIDAMVNQNLSLPRTDPNHLYFKNIKMDLQRFSVHKSGVKIELTINEFNLLKLLISVEGVTLTRDKIIDALCGVDYFGASNFVDVHIKSLRRKLEDNPRQPKFIMTVRGVGYRISDQ